MSDDPFSQTTNPYASPMSPMLPPTPQPWMVPQQKRPTFCTAMIITDLVFCALRVPLVLFGFMGLAMIESGKLDLGIPMEFVWWEMGSGAGIVVFGLLANILLLNNKRIGVLLGYLAIIAALASVAVGAAEMFSMTGKAANPIEESARKVGALLGVVVRIGINFLYGIALMKFAAWHDRQKQPDPHFGA